MNAPIYPIYSREDFSQFVVVPASEDIKTGDHVRFADDGGARPAKNAEKWFGIATMDADKGKSCDVLLVNVKREPIGNWYTVTERVI